MPPAVSGASRRARAGGRQVPVALLLALCLGARPSAAACPPPCLCASDIVSCSGRNLSALPFDLPGYAAWLDLSHNALAALRLGWISGSFGRLATLVLNRNAVRLIEAEAFAVLPRLTHLDLSSNRLTALEASVFAGLGELRELLLFGNQIARVDPGALRDLRALRRVYLSGNGLTDFPPGLLPEAGGSGNLSLLDLSSNRLTAVPVQEVLSLSRGGRVYLQGNPLACRCPLRALLEYWAWKRYDPFLDFRGGYPCLDDSASECRQPPAPGVPLETTTYRVEPGKRLRVPCQGSGGPNATAVFWVTPTAVLSSSADDPRSNLVVFPNGTLEIRSAGPEDAGEYACVAPRGRRRGPLEVSVVVANASAAATTTRGSAHRGSSEHFNTAFTTLASCVVSIVLVLLYLYLTPCRCRDNQGGRRCGGRALILCSDPREVEAGQRRSNGKRVAFLEPQTEDAGENGVSKSPFSGHVATEGILKNGSRTVEEPLRDPAP